MDNATTQDSNREQQEERGASPSFSPAGGSGLMPELCGWSLKRNEDYAVKVAELRGLVSRLTEARLNPSAWISPEDITASLTIFYESKAEATQGPNDGDQRPIPQ